VKTALNIALALITLIAGTGCTNPYQTAANNIVEEYDAELRPKLKTWTRKDVLSRFGVPKSKMAVEGIEVWEYRFEAGIRGNANAIYRTSDQLRFEFNAEGVMIDYSINVTR
jgi:hypothetical protein